MTSISPLIPTVWVQESSIFVLFSPFFCGDGKVYGDLTLGLVSVA